MLEKKDNKLRKRRTEEERIDREKKAKYKNNHGIQKQNKMASNKRGKG